LTTLTLDKYRDGIPELGYWGSGAVSVPLGALTGALLGHSIEQDEYSGEYGRNEALPDAALFVEGLRAMSPTQLSADPENFEGSDGSFDQEAYRAFLSARREILVDELQKRNKIMREQAIILFNGVVKCLCELLDNDPEFKAGVSNNVIAALESAKNEAPIKTVKKAKEFVQKLAFFGYPAQSGWAGGFSLDVLDGAAKELIAALEFNMDINLMMDRESPGSWLNLPNRLSAEYALWLLDRIYSHYRYSVIGVARRRPKRGAKPKAKAKQPPALTPEQQTAIRGMAIIRASLLEMYNDVLRATLKYSTGAKDPVLSRFCEDVGMGLPIYFKNPIDEARSRRIAKTLDSMANKLSKKYRIARGPKTPAELVTHLINASPHHFHSIVDEVLDAVDVCSRGGSYTNFE
jgi:hypothetical protein